MSKRILFVDDDANLLQSVRRSLRNRYELTIAEGGAAGLATLQHEGPFAVIVSDMRMPGIDGLALLRSAKEISSDTVRIMLTGNVDQQTAVDSVNEGAIFRFVNKPCPAESLAKVLDDALHQYSLITAEKQLLSQTLTGSVAVMTELLSLVNPAAFGRGGRLRSLARRLADHLEWQDTWQYEIAAMLSQIGCVGNRSTDKEACDEQVQKSQAELSSSIVGRIPRLERIASMIGKQYQNETLDDAPQPVQNGAKMLRILCDFDHLHSTLSLGQTVRKMQADVGHKYDPLIFQNFSAIVMDDMEHRDVPVSQLSPGMILDENVLNQNGDILISKGHELTESLIQRLHNFSRNSIGVREPITVRCPCAMTSAAKVAVAASV